METKLPVHRVTIGEELHALELSGKAVICGKDLLGARAEGPPDVEISKMS